MAETNYYGFVYPDEGERPYYDKISNFFNSLDRAVYSRLEDWNYVLFGGGTITFDSGSGSLSWTSPIYLLNLVTGYKYIINAGSIDVSIGDVVYIPISRKLNEDKTVTFSKTNTILNVVSEYDGVYLFGIRAGNNFVMRNFWTVK